MKPTISLALFLAIIPSISSAKDIVSTGKYRWTGDSIIQGEFKAWANSPYEINSTYHATPGYYMGIRPQWKAKNDLSDYPQLETPNLLHKAVYNMGLDEMVNAVEPDSTLRTGAAWGGVWTRDVSYSIILSMAYMQPEASRISLMKKVDSMGRIIQDTGSGGAWPISTDREIWAVAAFEVYKATGDQKWLEYIYPIIKRSLDADLLVAADPSGLVKGETSFIDWREQSHPRWMQTADIAETLTLSTSIVHSRALTVLSQICDLLGHKDEARYYETHARSIADAINRELWVPQAGYYAMYLYGGDYRILNPRAETLGESLAILWDIASPERARIITESNPTTPFGVAIFYPQIADMPPYHNNALWPWVAAYWAMANAKAGNEQGVVEAIGSIMRPAALFCTNKENFVLDNGDIATQLNSSNMLWCLAGNIAMTHKILFGIQYGINSLDFKPFVPEVLAAERSLKGFKYRNATLDITIKGYGDHIKNFTVNGRKQAPSINADATGHLVVEIEMADSPIPPLKVNHRDNLKAPLTPIVWLENNGSLLVWNPIEYIDHYRIMRNGREIARVKTTSYDASVPGEYLVIGVAKDGTESFAGQPRSNRETIFIDVPGENTSMTSAEIAYPATEPVAGYRGKGYVETDHTTGSLTMPVTVPEDGDYVLRLRYASGNGSVNTENRATIRTVSVDGKRAGAIIMPQRGVGNWNDWGLSTPVQVHLEKGTHAVSLTLEPENENMNIKSNHALIDGIQIVKL